MKPYERRKEFQKIAIHCDFYHHGICVVSPCWCRKELKEALKKQALNSK